MGRYLRKAALNSANGLLLFVGTDTSTFAGFRACSCLKGFHRTHLFEGCTQCDEEGLQCVDDHVKLKKGYWWKWENQTHKQFYESFARNPVSYTHLTLPTKRIV